MMVQNQSIGPIAPAQSKPKSPLHVPTSFPKSSPLMSAAAGVSKWVAISATIGAAITSVVGGIVLRRKWRGMESKVRELERAMVSFLEKVTAERQGRIRAQQLDFEGFTKQYLYCCQAVHNGDLRAALLGKRSDDVEGICYPMGAIGIIHSCFSTRNGTPRQPLLVPLARACLVFDASRVPPACLEGVEGYSHCWIIYVFHLNTDLEKLWKEPSRSKLKAKVRVPRLNGETTGVFATRSPHRPCPIGLTVAKVEAVHGNMVLLSGIDLVDGTPVLDIKPYLPYCDSINEATVPEWVMADNVLAVNSISFSDAFSSTLADCWDLLEPWTLYSSPEQIQTLIKQVLLWDIRSPSQRKRPRNSVQMKDHVTDHRSDQENLMAEEQPDANTNEEMVVYHLALEGLDISYRIDDNADVTIDSVVLLPSGIGKNNKTRPCSYTMWKDMLGSWTS